MEISNMQAKTFDQLQVTNVQTGASNGRFGLVFSGANRQSQFSISVMSAEGLPTDASVFQSKKYKITIEEDTSVEEVVDPTIDPALDPHPLP